MESHTLYMIHVSSTCAILINRQIHIYCYYYYYYYYYYYLNIQFKSRNIPDILHCVVSL